jgi:hypothetical protein
MENFVDFNDVELGSSNMNDFQQLAKALTTGEGYTPTTQTGGGALRLESLQATLKSLTFKTKDAVLWQRIPKKKAFSTVEEYSRLLEVGDANFYSEGGLPEESDSVLNRQFEIMKFLGTVGKVSNPAMAVRNLTDAKALETQNRTMSLIRKMNQILYFGNAAVNTLESSGLLYHVVNNASADNVIDLKGKQLRPNDINTGATVIADNYGKASHLFLSYQAHKSYLDNLMTSKYFVVGQSDAARIVGINPDQWQTGQPVDHLRLRGRHLRLRRGRLPHEVHQRPREQPLPQARRQGGDRRRGRCLLCQGHGRQAREPLL